MNPESALESWAWWVHHRQELGWPRESCEVRAMWAAQTASIVGRDNSVRWLPVCKETRPCRSGSIPRIDGARLGPRVDRLLRDLDGMGAIRIASVLRARALYPREPVNRIAGDLGLSERTFYRLRRKGLEWLGAALSVSRETRIFAPNLSGPGEAGSAERP